MIRAIKDGGFQLTFANGWTVSVMFRSGNYCSTRNVNAHTVETRLAEVYAFHETPCVAQQDVVRGWQSPDAIAAYIAEVAARPAYSPAQPRQEDAA